MPLNKAGRPQKQEYPQEAVDKIASLELKGYLRPEMAKETGLSTKYIKSMQYVKRYKETLARMRSDIVAPILAETKTAMLQMADLAMCALKKNLQEGSMDAVKVWLKGVGLDVQEEKMGDTTLNIVFPHSQKNADILVSKEGEEHDNHGGSVPY